MKTFIVAIVVTLLLLIGIGVYIFYLNDTADTFLSMTNNVTEFAQNENWDACLETSVLLEEAWKKNKDILCAFTDHGDLDKMEQTLYEMNKSILYRNQEDAVRYAAVLTSIIERLRDNESITWENILKSTPWKSCAHKIL